MQWHLRASEKIGNKGQTRQEWADMLRKDGLDKDADLILNSHDEPELFDDLAQYWNAFHILSSSRSAGMSIGAIPLPAYESYFRIMGVDSLEERLDYIRFVGIIDNEYLQWQGEKHDKESKKNKAPKSQPAPKPKRR